MIQQWTELKSAAMELQRRADGLSRLQDRIRAFRHGLALLDERTARAARDVATVEDLEHRIAELKVVGGAKLWDPHSGVFLKRYATGILLFGLMGHFAVRISR